MTMPTVMKPGKRRIDDTGHMLCGGYQFFAWRILWTCNTFILPSLSFSRIGPQVGARLKQRLNRTLLNAGLPAFDEKQFGYRKFTEFLVAELGEHLIVEKPVEGGDIQITLKHPSIAASAALAGQNDTAHSSSAKPLPVRLIRGDIWQAFTHLNEHRKRYLDRAAVRCCIFDSEAANVALVAEAPERFVEIPRVDADTQLSWMQQFLAISSFPNAEAAALAQLLEQPYSSQLSVLFGRALGKRQAEWKRYRAERVTEVVQNWAGEHEIPLSPCLHSNSAALKRLPR